MYYMINYKSNVNKNLPVDNYPVRLVSSGGLVEHDEMLLHHGAELVDDLLPVLLDAHSCSVPKHSCFHDFGLT